MNRILPILAVALLLVGGGVYYMTRGNTTPTGISISEIQSSDEEVELAPDMIIGNENAPLTIIEYASFTCYHCANFHMDVFKKLKTNYVDTGKVKFIHREVFFDRFGLWAGLVARCGGDVRYFGLIDLIYSSQTNWIGQGEPDHILDSLRKIGRTAGMSDDEINACLQDEDQAQSLVATYQANATADEIDATPSFVIDGTKYSNMSYDDFATLIDEKLAE